MICMFKVIYYCQVFKNFWNIYLEICQLDPAFFFFSCKGQPDKQPLKKEQINRPECMLLSCHVRILEQFHIVNG